MDMASACPTRIGIHMDHGGEDAAIAGRDADCVYVLASEAHARTVSVNGEPDRDRGVSREGARKAGTPTGAVRGSRVKKELGERQQAGKGGMLAGCLGRVSQLGGYSVTCGLTLVWIF
jgi:hypothetical protein